MKVFTLRCLYVSAISDLIETMGFETAIKKAFKWGFMMGHEEMIAFTKDIEKMKPFEDAPLVAQLAWYTGSGHFPTGIESRWETWNGYKIFILRFWDNNCPWCKDVQLPSKKPICAYPIGAYEGAYQTSQTILYNAGKLDIPRFSIAREVKCRAAGDDVCEYWVLDFPYKSEEELKNLFNIARKKYPKLFETIKPEYSLRLREEI